MSASWLLASVTAALDSFGFLASRQLCVVFLISVGFPTLFKHVFVSSLSFCLLLVPNSESIQDLCFLAYHCHCHYRQHYHHRWLLLQLPILWLIILSLLSTDAIRAALVISERFGEIQCCLIILLNFGSLRFVFLILFLLQRPSAQNKPWLESTLVFNSSLV